jgi:hypothetical protein
MKKLSFSLLAAALATGVASAATAYTTPVGYETLPINAGTNYIGVRLHESTVAAGLLAGASGTVLTVAEGVADALVAGTTYILEINSGVAGVEGVITLVSTWDAGANTITTDDNLPAILTGFVGNENFALRPVSNFSSIFGATNSAGLTSAASFAASDQIWLYNGTAFDKYYYAAGAFGQPSAWKTSAGTVVDPDTINLVYTDGIILISVNGNDLTVTGEVKTGVTRTPLIGASNYVGGIYPTTSTIESAFGAANTAQFTSAASFAASDQIWLYNGSGFDKYYYAAGAFGQPSAWKTSAGALTDPATVEIPAGYLIINTGADQSILVTPPSGYEDL